MGTLISILCISFILWMIFANSDSHNEKNKSEYVPPLPILDQEFHPENPEHIKWLRECIILIKTPGFNHKHCPNFEEFHKKTKLLLETGLMLKLSVEIDREKEIHEEAVRQLSILNEIERLKKERRPAAN
jgi:hypothetical protein